MIKVDVSGWNAVDIEALPAIVDGVVRDLATLARGQWVTLAQQQLHTTGQDYIRGIQRPVYTKSGAVIVLKGVLPNMLELGWSGGDMRDIMLRSGSHRKTSAEGYYYRVVPFRNAGPRASGRTGTPMGAQYGDSGRSIGNRVYQAARKLAASRTGSRGGHLPAGLAEKVAGHHATDPFAGMIREEAQPGRSTYTTFRTISTNPGTRRGAKGAAGVSGAATANWIHPGLRPLDLAGEVQGFVERHVAGIVAAALEGHSV